MALTKITANIIEDGAISTASLANTSITADKLHTTLDLTGKAVTVATATAGDNDTTVASTAFVSTAIANLADSAPATLDTLNELAAALGDDANFSTTVTNSIALKAPLASPTFTGTVEIPNLTISSAQGSDGQVLTSTGSGIAWEDAVGGVDGIVSSADATAITIDSSENVGIGNASPQVNFVVGDGTNGTSLEVTPNESSGFVNMNSYDRGSSAWRTMNIGGDIVTLNTGGSERLRVASSGDVQLMGGNQMTNAIAWYNTTSYELASIENVSHPSYNDSGGLLFKTAGLSNSGMAERMRIDSNGDVSFNGGVVKGARQTINHQGTTNAVTVSGNTYNTTMTSLNVTTTGNSKLLIWAHSGQILKSFDNANPQMRIEVNGTFIGSAHDGNHYWYATAGANSSSARVWLTNFGASGTLSAGTHTIRLVAGAYGANHTFNYQNQNCHMVVMEVGA